MIGSGKMFRSPRQGAESGSVAVGDKMETDLEDDVCVPHEKGQCDTSMMSPVLHCTILVSFPHVWCDALAALAVAALVSRSASFRSS